MYANGVCNPECNIEECAYDGGDCSIAQQGANCLQLQQQSGVDLSKPPVSESEHSFPLAMQLRFKPLDFYTDKDSGQMTIDFELIQTLQYSDPRLAASPCAGGLAATPSLLSASKEEVIDILKAEPILTYRSTFYNAPL